MGFSYAANRLSTDVDTLNPDCAASGYGSFISKKISGKSYIKA